MVYETINKSAQSGFQKPMGGLGLWPTASPNRGMNLAHEPDKSRVENRDSLPLTSRRPDGREGR